MLPSGAMPMLVRWARASLVALFALSLSACSSTSRTHAAATTAKAPIAEDPNEKESLTQLDKLYRDAGQHKKNHEYEAAVASLRAALDIPHFPAKLSGIRGTIHYDIACSEVLLGRTVDALQSLTRAAKEGFADAEQAATDDDLAPLRALSDFARVWLCPDSVDSLITLPCCNLQTSSVQQTSIQNRPD